MLFELIYALTFWNTAGQDQVVYADNLDFGDSGGGSGAVPAQGQGAVIYAAMPSNDNAEDTQRVASQTHSLKRSAFKMAPAIVFSVVFCAELPFRWWVQTHLESCMPF